jgi:polysaccharide deacetylase family protein (PEP-CTERM system associated)
VIRRHAFTVDVEDWYQGIPMASGFKDTASHRLEKGLDRLLELMESTGARGTFFVLGPVAQAYPAATRRIADAGHEDRQRFEAETRRARDVLADITGRSITAYRAAYFSVTRRSFWALEVLASLGFRYDSSIFPVKNWRYGISDFHQEPTLVETPAVPIWEFPLSVLPFGRWTVPVSGGAYFRIYPYALSRANFRRAERLNRPVIFYLHPWELDPDHPRVRFHWKARLTHYANLRSTEPKLKKLLREFQFGTISEVIETHP